MIQITQQMRILVALEPADFRKGIDGLCRICREELSSDPFSGAVFVFRNRRRTAVKLLAYDGQGYWLCHKRLSQGRFLHWPESESEMSHKKLLAHEVGVLLFGGNPENTQAPPQWRPIISDVE